MLCLTVLLLRQQHMHNLYGIPGGSSVGGVPHCVHMPCLAQQSIVTMTSAKHCKTIHS